MPAEIAGLLERLDSGVHSVTVFDRSFVLGRSFDRWFRGAARSTGADVIIDLAHIDAIDQELLSRLLRLRRSVAPHGTRLALVCRDVDFGVLELARFGSAFRLSTSRLEALRELEASRSRARTAG